MKRPTSFDIAAITGVSQTTVSRALSHSPLVNEETRQKILDVARQLHYKVDSNARKLRSKKIHTMAVLISADLDNPQNPINPFFLPLIGSILQYAGEKGFDIITSLQQPTDDWGTDYGFSRRADGIIFLGCKDFESYTNKFEYLNEVGDPWVVWGVNRPDCARLCIGSDNEDGGFKATSHLIRMGRRRIAYFGKSSPEHPEFKERYDGYRRALAVAGIDYDPKLHRDCFLERDEGFAEVGRMIGEGVEFDAVFASCDLLAMGVLQGLNRNGFRVPHDVAVIGFDDLWVCSSLSPALSTMRQDTEAAARVLVDGLSALIENEPVKDIRMPTQLVVRESCGGLSRMN